MKILVTGGCGFLGSNLCELLLEEKENEVYVLDNLMTGTKKNLDTLKITKLFIDEVESFVWPEEKLGRLDQIYNLACPASPPQYQKDELKTLATNFEGTQNMLELARRHNATILLSSTSEAYGEPLVHPQTEDYRGNVSTTGPRACYDEGKRVAETLMYCYARMFGTQIRVARIFNTYGPKLNPLDGRVMSNFVLQALTEQDLTVYGDGSQSRSFCYVSDLIAGLQLLMNSDQTEPVNLGNPTEITMLELAKIVIAATESKSKIIYRPLPKDDPTRRCPEISRAKKVLGWSPKIDLTTGIQRMIAHYREQVLA